MGCRDDARQHVEGGPPEGWHHRWLYPSILRYRGHRRPHYGSEGCLARMLTAFMPYVASLAACTCLLFASMVVHPLPRVDVHWQFFIRILVPSVPRRDGAGRGVPSHVQPRC